jgi:RHS repeat-associated protein
MKRLLILALAVLAITLPLSAQDTSFEYNQGFNSYNSFQLGLFDSVNEDSLSLMVDVPVISYPQRGALPDLKLNAHYSAWSWYMNCSIINGAQQCRWLPGTQSGVFLSNNFSMVGGQRYCSNKDCGPPCPCRLSYLKDGSGAIHDLGLLSTTGVIGETTDGSGIRADSSGRHTRNGISIALPNSDLMGNTIGETYVANGGSYFTDSVNRTIPSDLPRDAAGNLLSGCAVRNYPKPGGGTAPITFCLGSYTYTSQFPNDGYNAYNYSGTQVTLQSITLPNNTSWQFSYNTWGDLIQISSPTGGIIKYTWGNKWLNSNSTEAYARVILTRTENANDGSGDKIWTYSATLNGTVYPGVTDPDRNFTVFSNWYTPANYTNSGVWTRRQFYTSASVLLKTVDTSYMGAEDPLDKWEPNPRSMPIIQYILPTGTTTTWPNGQVSQTILTYDSTGRFTDVYTPGSSYYFPYGNIVEKQEYDYGSSPHGALLRDTKTAYQWQANAGYLTANVLDLSASVTVYDSTNNTCKSQANPCAQTTYGYDENNGSPQGVYGNQTSVTRWLNTGTSPKTQYVYNSNGMRTKMCDPIDLTCSNPTRYTYDSTGAFLYEVQYPVTNGIAHNEFFNYDSNTGLMISHTDQNTQQTSYQYDSMRRLTSVSYPDGGSETYSYPSSTSFTFTKAAAPDPNFTETGFVDGFGRPKQSKTTVPTTTCSSTYSYVDTTYDNEGRKFSVSNPYCATNDTTYGLTKTYYDVLNRVTSVVKQDGNTVSADFSAFPCITATDEAGKKRKSCSDGLGRTTSVLEDPNGLSYPTSYTYDALDNLLSVTQSGSRQRHFYYDSLSQLTQAANPESGTINYTYDANGNVKTKIDARSITTTYSYDALNRLTYASHSDGTPPADYTYDSCPSCAPFTSSNSTGRLVHASNDVNADRSYSYDAMGRVTSQAACTPSNCNFTANPVSASYDLAGNLIQLGYPSGRVIKQQYNAASQPTQVTFDNISGTSIGYNYLSNASYSPSGAPTSLTLGNGVIESASSDNRLRPCNLKVVSGANTWLNRTNNFYPTPGTNCQPGSGGNNGNVVSIADNLQANRTQKFGYDGVNRISSAATQGTSGPDCWAQSFGYDAWDNLLSATPTQSGCPMTRLGLSVNANNQITNPGFSYDAAGDLLTDGISNYAYDAESRIKTVNTTGATYTYDAQGNRVRKDVSGSPSTEYIYFNGQVIAEKNVSSGDWNDYVYAGGKRLVKATNFEYALTIQGTNCSNCGSQYTAFAFANAAGYAGYVMQAGDKVFLKQYQTAGAQGGMSLWFSDGTYTVWNTYDQDGQLLNEDTFQQTVHYRWADLSAFAGKTLSTIYVDSDIGTSAGTWNIVYEDIVLVSADGTVRPIYVTGQTSVSLSIAGTSGVTGRSYWAAYYSNRAIYPQNTTSYYHGDHLGSARLLTNWYGYPVWSGTFLPFGQEWNPQITVNHYKFTGKERDGESGLDDFGARYYSSQYGRFMIPDWAAKATAVPYAEFNDPQTLNLYGYVRNNPMSKMDADGHEQLCYCELDSSRNSSLSGFSPRETQIETGVLEVGSSLLTGGASFEAAAGGSVVKGAIGLMTAFGTGMAGVFRISVAAKGNPEEAAKTAETVKTLTDPAGNVVQAVAGPKAGATASDISSAASLAAHPSDAVKDPAGAALTVGSIVKDVKSGINGLKSMFGQPAPPQRPTPPPPPPCKDQGHC